MPTPQRLRQLRYRIKEFIVRDFSGGPNVRDAASELAANEDIDAWNVSFDERGGVGARLGYAKRNGAGAYPGGVVNNQYYSGVAQAEIVQAQRDIYKGMNLTPTKTFSTAARVGIVDFAGKVCVCHPVDGLFTSTDGSTWTPSGQKGTVTVTIASPAVFSFVAHGLIAGDAVYFETSGALPTGLTADTTYYVIAAGLTADAFEVSTTVGGTAVNTSGSQSGTHTLFRAGAPKGNALLAWQNKLWVAGQGSSRVTWSAPGDPSYWPATNFIDLREKDNEPVVALAGAAGIDIQGRQGMLAYKRRSTYRIFNSSTGEYSTVDTSVGAASAISVTSYGSTTYALSERGIFATNGIGANVEITAKYMPLWDFTQINFSNLDLFAAGRRGNRLSFSLCRAGSSANDLSFEYLPDTGSIAPGSNAMSCYATYGLNTEFLLGGSPTVTGQNYQMFSGGTDDGTAIASRLQTRWFEPSVGFLTQLWEVRLQMRGSFNMAIRKDYANTDYLSQTVTGPTAGTLWDSGAHWDSFFWASPSSQQTVVIPGWGNCRQFSLRITASTTTTMLGPQILGGATATTLGAWGLYGVNILYLPLGWA